MSDVSVAVKQKYNKKRKRLGILDTSGARLAESLQAYLRTGISPGIYTKYLINYGRNKLEGLDRYERIFNHPDNIKNASNKLKCLDILSDNFLPVVSFFTDEEMARNRASSQWVMCRTLLNSSSGKGIVLAKSPEEIVPAPLYTGYYKKRYEFRYHVVGDRVISVQQKKRLSSEELEARGMTRGDSYIRNLDNGYIFAREGVTEIPEISEICIKAIKALGLDFGAVDVLAKRWVYDKPDGSFVICEVNTAPGLQGTTLEDYTNAFKEVTHE